MAAFLPQRFTRTLTISFDLSLTLNSSLSRTLSITPFIIQTPNRTFTFSPTLTLTLILTVEWKVNT